QVADPAARPDLRAMAAVVAGSFVRSVTIFRPSPTHRDDPPAGRHAYGDDVQAGAVAPAGRRPPQDHARSRGRDRFRELGAHARALRALCRPGERRMDARDRSPVAGDSGLSTAGAPAASATVDGRRLRSERTRQAIIEAYLALLRDNP